MRIYVTYNDIVKGRPGSVRGCPIAIATKRAFLAKFGFPCAIVTVGDGVGIYVRGRVHYLASLTRVMNSFMESFDIYGSTSVKPYSILIPFKRRGEP